MKALWLCSVFFMTSLVQAQPVLPDMIWVFDNDHYPVKYASLARNHPLEHFNLDQTANFEKQFSLGLSGSPKVAKKQALKRIQKLSQAQLEQFKHSYTGIVTAFQMGVRQVPAVVFEYQGYKYVVYGQQRADKALKEFQQWHQKH